MKNVLPAPLLVLLLTGCTNPEPTKFDASSDISAKESGHKIVEELPVNKRDEFQKAVEYLIVGADSVNLIKEALRSHTTVQALADAHIAKLNGLTGQQILDRYHARLESARIEQEKEAAEKKEQARVKDEQEAAEKKEQARVTREEKKEQARVKDEKEKVSSLVAEALALFKNKKFDEALQKYETMGELASGKKTAEACIKIVIKTRGEYNERMDYLDKVELTEFIAERFDTYLKEGVPGVKLSIKNNGSRSLDRVEVVVYFQDGAGVTIFEKTVLPVLVSEYSFGRNNTSLKPGYIREMGVGKYFTVDSPLSSWQEGKAFAKVVDVRFTP